jgi:hypothetical protein
VHQLQISDLHKVKIESLKSYKSSLNELLVNVSTHLFDSLVRPILAYYCEIWNRDVSYFNATESAKKNNFNVLERENILLKLQVHQLQISDLHKVKIESL